jgi:hypothetical protein
MFALYTKKLRPLFAVAALGIAAMAFSVAAEARGFGGGGGGFQGGGGFHGGMGGARMGGLHGGGMMRGVVGFRGRIAFAHPGSAGSAFISHRAFVRGPFFFHGRFANRRLFFARRRFVGPFAVGFDGGDYDYPYYDHGTYGEECFVVRQHVVNSWGHAVLRRRLVCG